MKKSAFINLDEDCILKKTSKFSKYCLSINRIRVLSVIVFISLSYQCLKAQTLGSYGNTSMKAGSNKTVTPGSAPANADYTIAYTNTNFTGILSVDSTTGVVTITDAKPAGTYTITVKAFGTGTATKTFTLTVNDPDCSLGLFTGSTNTGVGDGPSSVAIGDFNGDGKQDFATANVNSNTVSIRLGDGSGGFSGSTNIGVGSYPISVAIGDFNGDGKQDFATTNQNSYNVSIRLGDGSGGFSGSTTISVGSGPRSVAIGDFNGDGKQDFAIANFEAGNVSIRLGDGSGGFSGSTNIGVGSYPHSVAVGDFNGDGKQDFAAANISSVNVSIRLGDGSGGFSGSTNISVGSYPYSIAIGDFNGDGKQDFATANDGDDNVSIRLGDGNGGFSGSTNISVASSPYSVAIGDFNGDGKQDFATANYGSDDVSIRLGRAAEINVRGNSTTIADGDATPTLADHTDFDAVPTFSGTFVRTFTIRNTGNSNLTLSTPTISGTNASDFSVTVNPSSPVTASGSTTFQITFDPSANGVRNATLTLTNNDCDEASYDFAITGRGVYYDFTTNGSGAGQEINVKGNITTIADGDNTPSLSDHTSFGDLAPSTTLTRTYTIENTGTSNLTVSAMGLSGADASLYGISGISLPATITPSNSTTFMVTFTPTSGGLKDATVTITNDDADEASYDFAVRGERNCYTNSIVAKPTNDGVNTGGVTTNLYLGYGAQKDTLKAVGFGSGTTWSPATYLSCSTCSTTVFAATTAGSFTYTANNGCISNTVTIVVKDVRYSGSGTNAKVALCHYNTTTKKYQTLAVLTRGIASHFQYDARDYLGTCSSTNKRTDPYSELVIDENELEVICTPNPFSQSFTLNYNSTFAMDATILVYGMTGNLLEKTTVSGLSNEVKLGANLPNGIYTVSFNQGDKNRVFRMIKVD